MMIRFCFLAGWKNLPGGTTNTFSLSLVVRITCCTPSGKWLELKMSHWTQHTDRAEAKCRSEVFFEEYIIYPTAKLTLGLSSNILE